MGNQRIMIISKNRIFSAIVKCKIGGNNHELDSLDRVRRFGRLGCQYHNEKQQPDGYYLEYCRGHNWRLGRIVDSRSPWSNRATDIQFHYLFSSRWWCRGIIIPL